LILNLLQLIASTFWLVRGVGNAAHDYLRATDLTLNPRVAAEVTGAFSTLMVRKPEAMIPMQG